ncbi:MAG TPA: RteC domain-containing protein [Puia sp.]|nr:RteC domain-containing protein [Puia sp.]
MLDFTRDLYNQLLEQLENPTDTRMRKSLSSDRRLELIRNVISQVKERLITYRFTSEGEEICFFKTVLPSLFALYIYHREKFDLETARQTGSSRLQAEYQQALVSRMDDFFKVNAQLIEYHRSERKDLDRLYFLLDSPLNRDCGDLTLLALNAPCCPTYTLKVATGLAYSELEQDLRQQEQSKQENLVILPEDGRLVWTASKQGLVELSYALKANGAFNNGQADLNTITRYLEIVFFVHLGNVSSRFQKILYRVAGHTHYIHELEEALERMIDDLENERLGEE